MNMSWLLLACSGSLFLEAPIVGSLRPDGYYYGCRARSVVRRLDSARRHVSSKTM